MPTDIEPGTTIFIDANIFLYKIFDHWRYAESCGNLLKEVDLGRFSAVSSVFVCNEVFHRVMIAEVVEKHNMDPRRVVRYLKENPRVIRDLGAAWSAIENIEQIENLKIAGVGVEVMRLSLELSRNYGLLSNDAVHLATMQKEGAKTLASNDRDFERVDWVKLWKP
jgi:predicted nucleic acid-binding protein